MNQVQLIGNVGKDPEMSYTPAGKAVTKFSLAVNRKVGSGEDRKDETQWFNVVMWERLAEVANTYLHKGSKVFVSGRIGSRKYTDKNNVERDFWEVTATEMELLTPKSADEHAGAPADDGIPF